ncbi:hypothetical protein ACWDE9_42600 [Streptomyces olivaceoviridis]
MTTPLDPGLPRHGQLPDQHYGLIERSLQDTSIKDQASADATELSRWNA